MESVLLVTQTADCVLPKESASKESACKATAIAPALKRALSVSQVAESVMAMTSQSAKDALKASIKPPMMTEICPVKAAMKNVLLALQLPCVQPVTLE